MLFRNPLGTISLALLTVGALLWNDAFAKQASVEVVAVIRKLDPQRARRICGQPGGHDGTTCAPAVQSVCCSACRATLAEPAYSSTGQLETSRQEFCVEHIPKMVGGRTQKFIKAHNSSTCSRVLLRTGDLTTVSVEC
jgi:hypothetical protein